MAGVWRFGVKNYHYITACPRIEDLDHCLNIVLDF